MFLTQFDINVARRDAMRLLASPERLHAAVLGAFPPGQSVSDGARTLWRLDRGPARHDARLMICLLYTSPSPRDKRQSRMPSSA